MEVKIQIPDNCELIKDGDTYIVKEKKNDNKPRSWKEFCDMYPNVKEEYYINGCSTLMKVSKQYRHPMTDRSLLSSEEEAEAFLALMQLHQLRKAWVGDWKQEKSGAAAVIVYNINEDKIIVDYSCMSRPLSFPTQLMAYDFLGCFKDLCKTVKILL